MAGAGFASFAGSDRLAGSVYLLDLADFVDSAIVDQSSAVAPPESFDRLGHQAAVAAARCWPAG